ncbi:unnamed protein product [Heligmosomoides polygyrus]|uniref:OB_NTP_bind domain-containing protein n=1 Tax=Heligmosomoides polygyrus TaxID=6339 RepID=A0A3P7ZT30_HELPZ|nr:unnamed protein product [Heligmosomoides polygyrus]
MEMSGHRQLSVHPAVALHPHLVYEDEATPGFVSLDLGSPSAARPGLVSPLTLFYNKDIPQLYEWPDCGTLARERVMPPQLDRTEGRSLGRRRQRRRRAKLDGLSALHVGQR